MPTARSSTATTKSVKTSSARPRPSAAAIDSPAKRVVVTAAHCVYAEKNRCFSNWVFIPGYDNGKKPYGTFQAQRSHALRDYIHRGDDAGSDWNSDVAFVTTKDSEQGRRLVDAVGGHKVVTGKTTEFNANIFGCPHNLDRGRTLQTRSKRTKDAWVNRKRRFHTVTGCDLREGAFWRASFRRSRERRSCLRKPTATSGLARVEAGNAKARERPKPSLARPVTQ